MSGLTPEAARAAAAAYGAVFGGGGAVSDWFRAEAERLENAAKTPGQVLVEARGLSWAGVIPDTRRYWEEAAAAVIAHAVGPDRVVVDRTDGNSISSILVGIRGTDDLRRRLYEALQ